MKSASGEFTDGFLHYLAVTVAALIIQLSYSSYPGSKGRFLFKYHTSRVKLQHGVKGPRFVRSLCFLRPWILPLFLSRATRKAAPGTTAVLVDGLAPVAFAGEVFFLLTYRIPFPPSLFHPPLSRTFHSVCSFYNHSIKLRCEIEV